LLDCTIGSVPASTNSVIPLALASVYADREYEVPVARRTFY